ncbi:MAG: hypothetical protein M1156_00915 [Candidatus Marsarchaeota archaeon]|nr:hypothetical protein [Candidatus Marsarchaeota archaeon]
MGNVFSDSWETYSSNTKFVLIFSIPFVISFIIPLFAPLPSFTSLGAIFVRSASIFTNLNFTTVAVIIAAMFFSLLFISFAFVAISLVVKARKTRLAISKRVLQDIEKYIGKVFVVLIMYTIVLLAANIIGYIIGAQTLLTDIVGFFGFIPVFYAPSAIVIDNRSIVRSLKDSVRLVIKSPAYFIGWLLLATVVISVIDFVFVSLLGVYAGYAVLLVVSLFVLPYFVIFLAEAYMRRFPILKH